MESDGFEAKGKRKRKKMRGVHNITLLLGLKSQTSNSMIIFEMESHGLISGVFPEDKWKTDRQGFRSHPVFVNIHIIIVFRRFDNFSVGGGGDMCGLVFIGFFILYVFYVEDGESCDFFEIPSHGNS